MFLRYAAIGSKTVSLYSGKTQRVYSDKCYRIAVAQWLRCCATNRKVAGSIPAGVSGFFIDKILPIAL